MPETTRGLRYPLGTGAAADIDTFIQELAEDVQARAMPPIGTLEMFAGPAAPSDRWLLCEGQAVSRVTYADLYSLIGDTYGAGNGSTTFNLPNLKKRFPIGLDSATAAVDTLGETGGAFDHVHTGPSHTHPVNPPSTTTGGPTGALSVDGTQATQPVSSISHSHDVDIAEFTSGAGGTGNTGTANPPYIVLNFIIRVL